MTASSPATAASSQRPQTAPAADDLRALRQPGVVVDSDHPAVIDFARREAPADGSPREVAVSLYYAVRDGVRYDPYRIELSPAGLSASRCLENGYGFCISKAALLAAALRVHGIAARLGFADVRNHMTSPRLRATMGTDLFAFHGYTDVHLDGRWVKATPAFNIGLCEKAGTRPLDFDGSQDSILHPLDASGRRHMEYVLDRGTYADVPLEEIAAVWDALYPAAVEWKRPSQGGDFEREVESAA